MANAKPSAMTQKPTPKTRPSELKPDDGCLTRRDLLNKATIAAGLGSAGLLASCTNTPASDQGQKPAPGAAVMTSKNAIKWRVQTAWQPGTVGNEAFLRFTKKIAAMSGGRFQIEPFQEGALVGTFEMFDAVKTGVFEAMHGFPIYWAGKLPIVVFMTSFPLGPDQETHWEWFYGPGGGTDLAREAYASQKLFWVGPIQHGPNLIHSKVPIRNFEDFAGKKIRYPGGMVAEVFSAAGVSTVLLPGGEIYPALEKGVIDAADYVGAAINWNLGFAEVTKYIILPSLHQPVDMMELVVNMKKWQDLGTELQELLIAAVQWHSWDQWSAIHEADRIHYRKFEEAGTEIIRLPPDEVEKFRKIAVPLWYKWAKKHPLATRAFKIWLDYMLDTGFISKDWIAGQSL